MLWDYCCCIGKEPHEIVYPGLKSSVVAHTFNMLVHDHARPEQIKREEELAQISGLSGMAKML